MRYFLHNDTGASKAWRLLRRTRRFFVSAAVAALTPRPQDFLHLAVRALPSVYRYSPCASSALTAACAAASLAIGTRNGEQDT